MPWKSCVRRGGRSALGGSGKGSRNYVSQVGDEGGKKPATDTVDHFTTPSRGLGTALNTSHNFRPIGGCLSLGEKEHSG